MTLTSTAEYSGTGLLLSTTDAAGNKTEYGYNANTNELEWVQYPEDTTATRTNYTYDDMHRIATAAVTTDSGAAMSVAYTYNNNDQLTKIATPTTTYNFTYGDFGLRTNIKVGSTVLASYDYADNNDTGKPLHALLKLDYGNGDSVQYTYDDHGRVTKQTYEDGDTVTYQYDNSGALATVTDSATGVKTTYYYDFADRMMKYVESGTNYSHSVGYAYDEINNLTSLVETINGTAHTTYYTYDNDNRVTTVTNGSASETYTYDGYGRVSQKVTKNGTATVLTDTFTYRTPTTGTTSGQVSTLKLAASGLNRTYTYTYDNNGNILSVSDGTNTTSYVYDSAGQLLRENNQAAGKTWVWTYDNAGNILTRKEYAYTTGTLGTVVDTVTYAYGNSNWGDLLTSYDGVAISYDNIGNPLDDGTWEYTWEHGRQLASMTDGSTTWNYTYNSDGLRTKRTNGTTTYSYVYNGSSLSQMTVGTDTLYFAYDGSSPMAVTYNGTNYYYATNLQGDVVAILNSSGTAVVQYTYDAWGNILTTTGSMASTLGAVNPLTYRGYVFDRETGLYYLQSRYYNPEIGRFINADAFASTGQGLLGNNMFAYCNNSPILLSDPHGTASEVCFSNDFDILSMPWQDAGGGSATARPFKRQRIAVVYDGRHSGYFWGYWATEKGFGHQGNELIKRLSRLHQVEGYAYTTMGEFVECWNGLSGHYDSIYIIGHGWSGALQCNGEDFGPLGSDYVYADLANVSVSTIFLYCCNGATEYSNTRSIAWNFQNITGARVYAVADGKLNFSWIGCYPQTAKGGHWVMLFP